MAAGVFLAAMAAVLLFSGRCRPSTQSSVPSTQSSPGG